jgi:peptidoglycan/LPS O-acetylase OafA/YrhL
VAPEPPTARLRSIDFLRGVAALAVAFGHAVVAAPYTEIAGEWFAQVCVHIMWIAVTGVALFFVISGFCIHLGQARHDGVGTFRFGAFWRRRMWRLYPTYFVALCGSMALLLLHWAMGTGQALLDRYPRPLSTWLAADFGLHALMLHGLHPFFDQAAGNPPLWTLAREEYLYLMYPLLLVAARRLPWHAVALLLAGLTIAIELVAPVTGDWLLIVVRSAPALWIQWHLGVVAADAYRGAITLPVFWRQARWVPAWILMAYFLPFSAIWLGLAFFTALNACVGLETDGRWPQRGIVDAVAGVGLWSYSLYLVHHPVQTISLAVTLLAVRQVGVFGFVARALLLTLVSCIAGRLLFAVVERHFVSVRRTSRYVPITAGLGARAEVPPVL